jgi:hypothetical protein
MDQSQKYIAHSHPASKFCPYTVAEHTLNKELITNYESVNTIVEASRPQTSSVLEQCHKVKHLFVYIKLMTITFYTYNTILKSVQLFSFLSADQEIYEQKNVVKIKEIFFSVTSRCDISKQR